MITPSLLQGDEHFRTTAGGLIVLNSSKARLNLKLAPAKEVHRPTRHQSQGKETIEEVVIHQSRRLSRNEKE